MRAHDAMLNKDGQRRSVSSALAITSQERLYVIQVPSRPAAHCFLRRCSLTIGSRRCEMRWSRQRTPILPKAGMSRPAFTLD